MCHSFRQLSISLVHTTSISQDFVCCASITEGDLTMSIFWCNFDLERRINGEVDTVNLRNLGGSFGEYGSLVH